MRSSLAFSSANVKLAPDADGASFLTAIQVEFGPVQLLGRFFLECDKLLRSKGIMLTMGTPGDALATHIRNGNSWPSFPPMLDPSLSGIGPADSYCFVGRDVHGQVVAVQAGRIYRGHQTMSELLDTGQFVYGEMKQQPYFRFDFKSPRSQTIVGPFAYSGGLWVHPDYRGSKLCGALVRLSRAYALAHWNTAHTITFVSDDIHERAISANYGYKNIEPGVVVRDLPNGSEWRGFFLSIDRAELVDDLSGYLLERLPQINPAIIERPANKYA